MCMADGETITEALENSEVIIVEWIEVVKKKDGEFFGLR